MSYDTNASRDYARKEWSRLLNKFLIILVVGCCLTALALVFAVIYFAMKPKGNEPVLFGIFWPMLAGVGVPLLIVGAVLYGKTKSKMKNTLGISSIKSDKGDYKPGDATVHGDQTYRPVDFGRPKHGSGDSNGAAN